MINESLNCLTDEGVIIILRYLFEEYNNMKNNGNSLINHVVPIRILQEGLSPSENIRKKLNDYNGLYKSQKEKVNTNELYEEYPSLKEIPQPKSFFMRFIYFDLVTQALPNDFYESIGLKSNEINQIVLSITLYSLILQTYCFSDLNITNTQKKWLLGRDDFFLRLDDLQHVCGKITQKNYDRFLKLFSFNLDEHNYSNLTHQKLYSQRLVLFILNIEEFLDYMLLEIETLFRSYSTKVQFSHYQQKKGLAFEELVFDFLNANYKMVGHAMYYYPIITKKIETDIIIKEAKDLIIIECKSGTIDLRNASTDTEIKMKVKNLVKKAYKSLEVVAKYIHDSGEYCFSNKSIEIQGKSDIDCTLFLHLSMYPIDFVSSNIHIFDEDYLGQINKPKITMSFEHLASIIIDLDRKKVSLLEYLKKRQNDIIKYPKMSFDINELDLYFQLMDFGGKSILNEMKDNDFFKNFNENVKMVTTFKKDDNQEFRPSVDMLKYLDSVLLANLFLKGKEVLQINKRYIRYFEEYTSNSKL